MKKTVWKIFMVGPKKAIDEEREPLDPASQFSFWNSFKIDIPDMCPADFISITYYKKFVQSIFVDLVTHENILTTIFSRLWYCII